jgi:hypothetical protein
MKKQIGFLISLLVVVSFILSCGDNPTEPEIPSEGLMLYFPFNGNANDASGNNNHGTVLHGAVQEVILTEDRNGKANSAYSFDGVNDYIHIAKSYNFLDMESFTLSAWIYIQNYKVGTIISRANPGSDFVLNILSDGRLDFHFEHTKKYNTTSDEKMPLNTWIHIAGVRSGPQWHLFYQGKKIKTAVYEQQGPRWDGKVMHVGRLSSRSANVFDGKIDEVRIYNRALSESEIKTLSQN